MGTAWSKSDWRSKTRIQMPDYPDTGALNAVEERLSSYPPLVFAGEARKLRERLAAVAEGPIRSGTPIRCCSRWLLC